MQIKSFEFNGNAGPSFEEYVEKTIPKETACLVLDYPRAGRILLHNLPPIRNLIKTVIPANQEKRVIERYENDDYLGKIFFLEIKKRKERKFLRTIIHKLFAQDSFWIISNDLYQHNADLTKDINRYLGVKLPNFDRIFSVDYNCMQHDSQMRYFYLE